MPALPLQFFFRFLLILGLTSATLPASITDMELLLTGLSREGKGGVFRVNYDPARNQFDLPIRDHAFDGCLHGSWDAERKQLWVAANEDHQGRLLVFDYRTLPPVLNAKVPTGGRTACYVSFDRSGQKAWLANYSSPDIASIQLNADTQAPLTVRTGSGSHPKRQGEPHPHSAHYVPEDDAVWVADLGTDEVVRYPVHPKTGALLTDKAIVIQTAPGAGPRHVVPHPHLPVAYVTNELNSTVAVIRINQPKAGVIATVSTVNAGSASPNYISTAAVHPNGAFLVVANRGDDSLASIPLATDGLPSGEATQTPSGGAYPTFLTFSSDGKLLFVANQLGNNLTVFSCTLEEGQLQLQLINTLECVAPTWVGIRSKSL